MSWTHVGLCMRLVSSGACRGAASNASVCVCVCVCVCVRARVSACVQCVQHALCVHASRKVCMCTSGDVTQRIARMLTYADVC